MTISRLSSLPKDAHLVLGAGALLDLLGTARAKDILHVLRRRVAVETGVTNRLPDGDTGKAGLQHLVAAQVIQREVLSGDYSGIFMDLAAAPPPDDVSDEEAACIALAWGSRGTAVLEDAKAQRSAEIILAGRVLHSLDLITAPEVVNHFGEAEVAEMVRHAIRAVRMRIPVRFKEWPGAVREHQPPTEPEDLFLRMGSSGTLDY